jgi:hypothetical protein
MYQNHQENEKKRIYALDFSDAVLTVVDDAVTVRCYIKKGDQKTGQLYRKKLLALRFFGCFCSSSGGAPDGERARLFFPVEGPSRGFPLRLSSSSKSVKSDT